MAVQLSLALSILARAEAAERFMHANVGAFGAPSECHSLVSRGEEARWAKAVAKAEAVAGAPFRTIKAEALVRGGMTICSGDPRWQRFVDRVYTRNYPFCGNHV